MENGLYYCDANQLSLSAPNGYKLQWSQNNTASALAIADSKLIRDEFGDEWVSVNCTTSSQSVPVKKFRYQHRCGDTGFDDFSKNDAGLSPDKELQRLFNAMLTDAWTWNHRKNELVSYANEKAGLEYPGEFFYEKEPGAPLITVHSPSEKLLKQLSSASTAAAFYKSNGIETLKALFELASDCEMALVWQLSYGTNPIAISKNIDAVMKKLSTLCAAESIPLKQVETEDNLPAW